MTSIEPRSDNVGPEQTTDEAKVDSFELTTPEYPYQSNSSTAFTEREHDAISADETSQWSTTDFTAVLGNASSNNSVNSGTESSGEGMVSTISFTEETNIGLTRSSSSLSTATNSEPPTVTGSISATQYPISSTEQGALDMANATATAGDNLTQPVTDRMTITTAALDTTVPLDLNDGNTTEDSATSISLTSRAASTTETIPTTGDLAQITTQSTASHISVTSATTNSVTTSAYVPSTESTDGPTTALVESTSATPTQDVWTTPSPAQENTTPDLAGQLSTTATDKYVTTNAQTGGATSELIWGLEPLHFYLAVAGVAVAIILLITIVAVCVIYKKKKRREKLRTKENSSGWISRSNVGVSLSNITFRTSDVMVDPAEPASSRLSGLVNAPAVNIFTNQNDAFEEERLSASTVCRSKSSASPESPHNKTPEKKPKGLTAVSFPIVTPQKDMSTDKASQDETASSSSFHSNDSDDDKRQISFLYQPLSGGNSIPSTTESNLADSTVTVNTTTDHSGDGDVDSDVVSPARPARRAPPPPVSSTIPVAHPPPSPPLPPPPLAI